MTDKIVKTLEWGERVPAPSILLINPKFPHNLARAKRTASAFGIPYVVFTGTRLLRDLENRKRLPREERMKGYRDVTLVSTCRVHPLSVFEAHTPVCVEVDPSAIPLAQFIHPPDAVYIFGPEDGRVMPGMRSACHLFTTIPTKHCLNLADTVAVILYDRMAKEG